MNAEKLISFFVTSFPWEKQYGFSPVESFPNKKLPNYKKNADAVVLVKASSAIDFYCKNNKSVHVIGFPTEKTCFHGEV